jgi:hypothetical protein
LAVAPVLGLTFLVPELAITEARTLRPHADAVVDELMTHPQVVLTRMSPAEAAGVEELLAASRTFDVMAGWVVHLCRLRGSDHNSPTSHTDHATPEAPRNILINLGYVALGPDRAGRVRSARFSGGLDRSRRRRYCIVRTGAWG